MTKKEINITYERPIQFHTLRDIFTYARDNGFTAHDLQHVRNSLKNSRKKYPHNIHWGQRHWGVSVIRHERKDWYENKGKNTPVNVMNIDRVKGEWLVLLMHTDEEGWISAMQTRYESRESPWSNPIINPITEKGNKPYVYRKQTKVPSRFDGIITE